MSTTAPDPLDVARRLVGSVRPGEELEVVAATGTSTSVRAYDGEVEAFTSATTFGVGIRVLVGDRIGFASVGTFDPTALDEALDEARDNATFAEGDQWAGFVEPDGVPAPHLDLVDDSVAATPVDVKIDLALDLERRVRGADPRITGIRTAAYGDSSGRSAIVSTTGIEAVEQGTRASMSVLALAADGDAASGSGFDVALGPTELDPERVAAEAVDRALAALGAGQPPSTRLTIVLEPRPAASLLGVVGGMLTGDRVLKGRTPFADRLGDAIASPLLTLVDDPTDTRSIAASTHDGEGLASRPVALLDAGVLGAFVHDGYTGRRSGAGSTASAVRGARSTPTPGVRAMLVGPGARDLAAIVASIDHGLVVRTMSGLHSGVNAVSGDFSVGVEGLMIRDGALAEPIREATIASTVQRLLLDIAEVGSDPDWRSGSVVAPTLVIGDVSLSGS